MKSRFTPGEWRRLGNGRKRKMAIEGRGDAAIGGKIRLGMVGGGEGAFIGAVHRLAARMDAHYDLVAGALSSAPDRARRSGEALGLAADRIYDDYETMAKAESKRPDGVEVVAIVTPNHVHMGPTIAFLKAGIHVICDKPLALNLAEGRKIQAADGKVGQDLRAHPQLHRLSAGAAGARNGPGRRTRRFAPRAGRISAGLADNAGREERQQAGGVAHRSEALRARAARSATSAPTPTISPISSPASNSRRSRPT